MVLELEGNLDINFFKSKIQNIINKEFGNFQRRIIKEFPERLNFACPICGDSEKSNTKKRANLYFKSSRIKCYNCGERMSFLKFCEKYNEPVSLDDRIKLYNHIDSIKYNTADEYTLELLDKLIPLDKFADFFNNHPKSWLTEIEPVVHGSKVYNYLHKERLIQDLNNFYQGIYKVWRDGRVFFHTPVMISLNRGGNNLLGIQLRNLERNRNKRFYKIVEFEEIYNFMNPGAPLDEMDAISYNKLSHFYNILNVNFEIPVTIFEGFIDSQFYTENGYKNNIGMVGISNSEDLLGFLTESDEDLDLKFFYDNDIAGINKSQKMIKKGYSVFLWNKLFDKILENKSNKQEAKKRLANIVDLNDLVIMSNNYDISTKLNLCNYFSKDEFDILYLDKLIYDKNKKSLIRK